ncbi:MAG: DNA-formamidopyrimidine glycosylase family protein [Bdellovibrionota bacterium]
MEGPSLVIACEEFKPFVGTKILTAEGNAKLPFKDFKGLKLKGVKSWGKHFILQFDGFHLRIHFLMFGSYRIDKPRENRDPKMYLRFPAGEVYFYSCAIKQSEEKLNEIYDWSIDVMSDQWDPKKALKAIKSKSGKMVCDILMDQTIFSGVGNIIKNEVLYSLKMHPETKISALTLKQQRKLVKETRDYCWQFYEWKKIGKLKKNWKIFRKPHCPEGHGKVTKKPTGQLQRISHYCKKCQPLEK